MGCGVSIKSKKEKLSMDMEKMGIQEIDNI